MSVRRVLRGSACFALLATTSIASAGGGWHNGITRKLGIWYSDGYHAQEGCPTERVRGHGPSGHGYYAETYGYHGQDSHASPFADQYRSYNRLPYASPAPAGAEYDEVLSSERIEAQPTPAKPRTTVIPPAPNDPSMPTREGHSEARLPSSMFPLMPIR